MIKLSPYLFLVLQVWLMTACKTPVQELYEKEDDRVSEQFIRTNQYMLQRHQDQIAAFVERVGWKAEVTPSGLWLVIDQPGEGKRIAENMRVTYAFESKLLDGTPCYSATVQNPKTIVVGKGGAESGVEEGLQHLAEGAVATFLIPPHLAHGNFGDRDKIPGNSVLICKVQVLKVE